MSIADQLAAEHWLLMSEQTRRITACHCGVDASPDDDGYGDSVVRHIAAVAEAAVRAQIAADIEAVDPGEWALDGQGLCDEAARIARGDLR